MSTPIQISDAPFTVRVVKKVAPCGHCRRETMRDDMWAVNIKVFAPSDHAARHIQIRLCATCAAAEVERATEMQWDNAEMRVLD